MAARRRRRRPEGLWPDLRRRGSLLEADRIGRDGLAEPLPPGALLAEERRLFYVAATRARERLVVTAVKASAEDGDQPSRFLAELGVEPVDVTQRPRRPLAVAALVAELRSTTVDPAASPALRSAAAARLARLAALRDEEDRPLVPAADPDRWWGLYEPTHSGVPLRDRERPVALSGSALGQLADTCSLQWFLGREVRAEAPAGPAQGFGTWSTSSPTTSRPAAPRRPRRPDGAPGHRLGRARLRCPWKSRRRRRTRGHALERFLRWHVLERGRTPVASEHPFDVTLKAEQYLVRVRGSMDRVERDEAGPGVRGRLQDRQEPPSAREVARHPQLAVYQRDWLRGEAQGRRVSRDRRGLGDGDGRTSGGEATARPAVFASGPPGTTTPPRSWSTATTTVQPRPRGRLAHRPVRARPQGRPVSTGAAPPTTMPVFFHTLGVRAHWRPTEAGRPRPSTSS
ncbi:hypothetical protein GCM10020221_26470 [Streptomyces thioluteus]|uniref:DNA helicase n=1 Tax=Streptomyces thioluteus TaxID=66431 RepID=A0ABN3WVE5_STRTU